VTAEMAKASALGLMSDEQKKQLLKDKTLEFVHSNSSGEFKVNVSIKQSGLFCHFLWLSPKSVTISLHTGAVPKF
jgi:Tfp pilus assembly ATPase PilU